jgi:hypothetical protein
VSRESWFDVSFSLETVHLMREGGIDSVDFTQYDVHPPAYYYMLYFWSYLNPGISEYYWAQELSVLFMLGFFVCVYFALKKIYNSGIAGKVVAILAICSTYLHFGTEVRMYALMLFISAAMLLAIVEERHVAAGIMAFFMFMVHYYAAAVLFAFMSIYLFIRVLRKNAGVVSFVMYLVSGLFGLIFALFVFAIPQRMRTQGCWFQPPFITSWPDSLMYSFFMNEGGKFSFMLVLFYVAFLALIFLVFKSGFDKLRKAKVLKIFTDADEFHIAVLIGSLFSLMGLAAAPLLGGDGFAHLYHHRFFLVVTWMFAAVAIIEFDGWASKQNGGIILKFLALLFVIYFFTYYCTNAHHELENLMVRTPCNGTQIYIAHESPFSALPYEVYAREHNCYWLNFVSTNQTPRMLNGGGGDAMKQGAIFYNKTLPEDVDYYYIYAAGTVPIDGSRTIVAKEDGVELWFINRSDALSCTDKYSYYDNSTEVQHTVVACAKEGFRGLV